MRFTLGTIIVVLLLLCATVNVIYSAGDLVHQITCQVGAINEISVNEGSSLLLVTVGDSLREGKIDWAITTNETNKRIVGSLNIDMPLGTSLYVELEAPTESISKGFVALSTTPQDLVVGISKVVENNLKGRYMLVADTSILELQRTIIFTLTD